MFKAKLRKIGNSFGVIIPLEVITSIKAGDVITLDVITLEEDVITRKHNVITSDNVITKKDVITDKNVITSDKVITDDKDHTVETNHTVDSKVAISANII